MKYLALITVLVSLALTSTATAAGGANLCKSPTAQNGSGQAFQSRQACNRSKEVFAPTASIAPSHVVAGEQFWLTVTGFHPNTSSTVYFAITGEAPYASVTPYYPTRADGSFSIPFSFDACRQTDTGSDVTVDLTLTFVDSYGVHASARMVLC